MLQHQIIQQHWMQQQQQQQQQPSGGGLSPSFQSSQQGYDPSNYTSIYWNPTDNPDNSGLRADPDLPPAYQSINIQGSPPPYPTNSTPPYPTYSNPPYPTNSTPPYPTNSTPSYSTNNRF